MTNFLACSEKVSGSQPNAEKLRFEKITPHPAKRRKTHKLGWHGGWLVLVLIDKF